MKTMIFSQAAAVFDLQGVLETAGQAEGLGWWQASGLEVEGKLEPAAEGLPEAQERIAPEPFVLPRAARTMIAGERKKLGRAAAVPWLAQAVVPWPARAAEPAEKQAAAERRALPMGAPPGPPARAAEPALPPAGQAPGQ